MLQSSGYPFPVNVLHIYSGINVVGESVLINTPNNTI